MTFKIISKSKIPRERFCKEMDSYLVHGPNLKEITDQSGGQISVYWELSFLETQAVKIAYLLFNHKPGLFLHIKNYWNNFRPYYPTTQVYAQNSFRRILSLRVELNISSSQDAENSKNPDSSPPVTRKFSCYYSKNFYRVTIKKKKSTFQMNGTNMVSNLISRNFINESSTMTTEG